MKDEVKIFESPQFGAIRTTGTSDEPLFCLADICKVLELNPSRVKSRLKTEGVTSIKVGVQTGVKSDGTPACQNVEMLFVNEQNLTIGTSLSTVVTEKGRASFHDFKKRLEEHERKMILRQQQQQTVNA